MTGFGEARHQSDNLSIAVELRAVNNRYLKVITRATEPYNLFEPEVERLLRRAIRRGTLQVQIRCGGAAKAADFRLNTTALRSYLEQLSQLGAEMRLDRAIVNSLLAEAVNLPGVAPEPGLASFQPEQEWPLLERVLEEAVARLQKMRQDEGQHMAQELLALRDHIGREPWPNSQRNPHFATR